MEQDMTFNGHLSVLSAIIIGLAIVKLLQGIVWMIHGRQRIKMYWVHLAWIVFAIIAGTWHYWVIGLIPGDVRVADGFYGISQMLLTPLIIYLFAGLLFPQSGEDGPVDLKEFYYENRTWIFGTWVVVPLIPTVQDIFLSNIRWELFMIYFGVLMFGALAITRNQWYHMVVVILALLGMSAMIIT
jgi:hypothetical protein